MTWLEQLAGLKGETVRMLALKGPRDDGQFSMLFSGGTYLRAHHWRICERLRPDQARFSSFDHGQIYALPEKIDAIAILQERSEGRAVLASRFDDATGDLIFEVEGGLKLQILNLTGNEVWEINFPDNMVELSNYV